MCLEPIEARSGRFLNEYQTQHSGTRASMPLSCYAVSASGRHILLPRRRRLAFNLPVKPFPPYDLDHAHSALAPQAHTTLRTTNTYMNLLDFMHSSVFTYDFLHDSCGGFQENASRTRLEPVLIRAFLTGEI